MKVLPSPHPIATEGRSAEVQVLRSRTRYWEYGPAEAPVTVVAVHGFRGDHHGLESIVGYLRADDPALRVIAPDLPGFGESEPLSRTHDIAGYAAWLSGFLEALGIRGTAVLLGHSFGTIVVAGALAGGLPAPAPSSSTRSPRPLCPGRMRWAPGSRSSTTGSAPAFRSGSASASCGGAP
ncbi:hypothetical protein GCM10025866_29740 [Naasia aerilata]|uniref:AB hydrolase-1 domain-containing protein n=1 Tax=Naasia aerilata TaxID=1162966 RepID=A0ABN6XPY6_9MICO|nr:hypothetical protein GCM10025866_29740 [Naasia aerilata]